MKMNKTKLLLLCLFASVSLWWLVSAYSPTSWDQQEVQRVRLQIDTLIQDNNQNLRNLYNKTKVLKSKFAFDARLSWILWQLNDWLYERLYARKNLAKQSARSLKSGFVAQYFSWVQTMILWNDYCTWRYNTVDNISFANNFPTELTMVTRYREWNCWYYLPKNWRWPFQITSKAYGTGEINEQLFVQIVTDFIAFTKNKYANFEKANGDKINISYTNFDMTGLVRHGALYNWLSGNTIYGNITPMNPKYVRDNYWTEYSWATRDWIVSKFLKILDWEAKNGY